MWRFRHAVVCISAFNPSLHQSTFAAKGWTPNRQRKRFGFYLVTNKIHVYDGHSFAAADGEGSVRYGSKVRCAGIVSFGVLSTHYEHGGNNGNNNGTERSYLLSTFVPETKGKP